MNKKEWNDSDHAKLRRACMEEDDNKIRALIKEGLPIDMFEGLALRVCAFHGKVTSMATLLELGASKPKDLVKVCERLGVKNT